MGYSIIKSGCLRRNDFFYRKSTIEALRNMEKAVLASNFYILYYSNNWIFSPQVSHSQISFWIFLKPSWILSAKPILNGNKIANKMWQQVLEDFALKNPWRSNEMMKYFFICSNENTAILNQISKTRKSRRVSFDRIKIAILPKIWKYEYSNPITDN